MNDVARFVRQNGKCGIGDFVSITNYSPLYFYSFAKVIPTKFQDIEFANGVLSLTATTEECQSS